jgi:hypothetical protein
MKAARISTLELPRADGSMYIYKPGAGGAFAQRAAPATSRIAIAAVHVVADPLAPNGPADPACLDWDATMAYRRHLWSYGIGVAEGMDTAQRGMGLNWPVASELIERSIVEARSAGGLVVCGAGTDHLEPGAARNLGDVEAAYSEQCEFIESRGGRVVLMASRELARIATRPDDYARVYRRILGGLARPALIHWLGDMFDPALHGYWGHEDLGRAMDVCVEVISENRAKVDGVKISLLDDNKEVAMRRRLPHGVRMYTGDDFHFVEMIAGDHIGYSDALLGILDAIAPAAAAALMALDAGDVERYRAILAPTVPLSRHIFSAPTRFYKTGIVFLAYLNGHQSHFRMVSGLESSRSPVHLSELFVLADKAGLLRDPDAAVHRMRAFLALSGVA